ncbi:MAG: Lcl C-terminal domain-containing protein [Candidatus Scalindua sp.]
MIRKLSFYLLIFIFTYGYHFRIAICREWEPISIEAIEGFLKVEKNGPSHELIADLIREFGFSFVPTEIIKQELIKHGASDEIIVAIWKNEIYVTFNTDPPGGNIVIKKDKDGKSITKDGTAGNKYKLHKGGKYNVTVSLEGYIEKEYLTFTAKENKTYNIPLEIDWVDVNIKTDPPEANIMITPNGNGHKQEVTSSNKYKLQKDKEYNVKVSLLGYKTENHTITAERSMDIDYPLEIDWVNVKFNTEPPGAHIKITAKTDGHIKQEGTIGNIYKLQKGKEYKIKVSLTGYITQNQIITVVENKKYDYELPIDWINVNFTTNPPGANLSINYEADCHLERLNGKNYKLQRGEKYKVTVSMMGYRTEVKSITAKKENVELKLSPFLRSNYEEELSMGQIIKLPFFKLTRERVGTPGNCGYYTGIFNKDDKEDKVKKHDYKEKTFGIDSVVIDYVTGLMWHQSGSEKFNNWKAAKNWVRNLSYADFNDWRLPTVEEAISLLEPKCDEDNKMFIDPIFDIQQIRIWTGDTNTETKKNKKTKRVWYVHFKKSSYVDSQKRDGTFRHLFIRPVRSMKR